MDSRKATEKLLSSLDLDHSQYKFGHTKVRPGNCWSLGGVISLQPISLQSQLAGIAQLALCLTAALLKPCALQAEHGLHETEGNEKKLGGSRSGCCCLSSYHPVQQLVLLGICGDGCRARRDGVQLFPSLQSLGLCPAALNTPTLGCT